MKKFLYVFSALLFFGFLSSCEKDGSVLSTDNNELEFQDDCFFTNDCIEIGKGKTGKELTPFTKNIISYYEDNPKKKESINKNMGVPFWKHSIDWLNGTEDILYIPLIKKKKVNGFLIAFQNAGMSKPKFKVIKLSKIKNLPIIKDNAEKLTFIDQAHAIVFVLRFQQQIEGAVDCDLVSTLKKIEGKGKNISRQKNCWIETDEVFTCLKALIGGVWYFNCDSHIEYDLVCDESGSGEPSPDPDPDPNPDSGGGPSAPGDPGEEEEEECAIGYVWDAANGECVEEEEDQIDVSKIDAPNFNCLFENFMQGNSSLFNSTIRPFHDSNVKLTFKSYNDLPTSGMCSNSTADGCTRTTDINNNKVTIYISNPNNNPIDLASTILHEGLHASIAAYVHDQGVDVHLLNTTRLLQLYDYYKGVSAFADHYYMTET